MLEELVKQAKQLPENQLLGLMKELNEIEGDIKRRRE